MIDNEKRRPAAEPGGVNIQVSATNDTVPLTRDEQAHLDQLERVVLDGLDTFVAVGTALADIKDSRLYRQTHDSFEKYLEDRYDGRLSRRRAYQLIDAAEVCTAVHRLGAPVPVSERHARELINVPADVAAEVMTTVTNSGEKVTADAIKNTRTKLTATKTSKDDIGHAQRLRDAIKVQKLAVIADVEEALQNGVEAIVLLVALQDAISTPPTDSMVTKEMMAPIFTEVIDMLNGFVLRATVDTYRAALADAS